MTRKNQYYRKPMKIQAYKNDGSTEFVEQLEKHFNIKSLSLEHRDLNFERGDLRVLDPPVVRMSYVRQDDDGYRREGVHNISDGDWLIVDSGKVKIVSHEDFVKDYFFTSTETKTTMPLIEEIL